MKRRASSPQPRAQGFTLVEAIMVIVILGVLAGIVAVFIRAPILGYRDSVDRAEITDQADLALRRIARDVRLALPNSVRVNASGSFLEFLQTVSGARYLSSVDGAADGQALSFDDTGRTTFLAIGLPDSFARVRPGHFVVVYNLGSGFTGADAWQLNTAAEKNIARITALTSTSIALPGQSEGNTTPAIQITLADNPFAAQTVAMSSPSQRFQVVTGPVSYFCQPRADGTLDLVRAWGYPVSANLQVPPAGGQRAVIASRLTRCGGLFNAASGALGRAGLVSIDLALRGRHDNAAAIRLVHQVHVDNTP
jgi:MSHA biogenesis protein MshO